MEAYFSLRLPRNTYIGWGENGCKMSATVMVFLISEEVT